MPSVKLVTELVCVARIVGVCVAVILAAAHRHMDLPPVHIDVRDRLHLMARPGDDMIQIVAVVCSTEVQNYARHSGLTVNHLSGRCLLPDRASDSGPGL